MRFYLVDRIDGCTPGERIAARKLTSASEEYWVGGADNLVMPAALVLESLCQAGAWLLWASTDGRSRAALVSVDRIKFADRPVRPGEVLDIEGRLDSINDETAVLSGSVAVGGERVLEAENIMCLLIEAGNLEDPDATRERERLARGSASG